MINLSKHLKDPIWRLNHLYRIVDKNGRKICFKENPIQAKLNQCNDNRRIILKARQFGVTTNEVLKLFDYTIYNKNVTTCILAHERDAIKKIFRIVRRAYRFLPDPLKPKIDKGGGSMYEMFFPDINSLIYCTLESRGDTIHKLHVSEAAFVDHERLFATLQAVPLNGSVTLESTPNGMENEFYDIWNDEDSFGLYKKLFFPWFFHHEYHIFNNKDLIKTEEENRFIQAVKKNYHLDITDSQIKYRRFKQKEIKEKYPEEYPEDDVTCFLMSGQNVVDQKLIARLLQITKPVIE
jgi:hypothetical protein